MVEEEEEEEEEEEKKEKEDDDDRIIMIPNKNIRLQFDFTNTDAYNDKMLLYYAYQDFEQEQKEDITDNERGPDDGDAPLVKGTRLLARQAVQALIQRDAQFMHPELTPEGQKERRDWILRTRDRLVKIAVGMRYVNRKNDKVSYDAFTHYRKCRIRLIYNEVTKKISIKLKEGPLFDEYIIFESPTLRELMGFSFTDPQLLSPERKFENKRKVYTLTYPTDFDLYTRHVYVYTNIVKHSKIGSHDAAIIRALVIPDKSKTDAISYNYSIPQYYSLSNNQINYISIGLYDEIGQSIAFANLSGVLVVLHFRKKKNLTAVSQ